MPSFLKTVELNGGNDMLPYIQVGQYVKHPVKGTGRVVANRNGKVYVSYHNGDTVRAYTRRFTHAVWHHKGGDIGTKVQTAPLSLTMFQLKSRLGIL